MAILKNEPLIPFEEGNYSKPHHIIVSGSDEEIGYNLASLAKEKCQCQLLKHDDPVYGEARREFFRRRMIREGLINEMIKGLSRTYKVSQKNFKS